MSCRAYIKLVLLVVACLSISVIALRVHWMSFDIGRLDRVRDKKSYLAAAVPGSGSISTNVKACDEVLNIDPETYSRIRLTSEFNSRVADFNTTVNKARAGAPLTGHVMKSYNRLRALHYLAQLDFVRTICETGFNAGHSSFLFLTANPRVVVHSFDTCGWHYCRKMARYMEATFPGRITVHIGDSKREVPHFSEQNSNFTCDLMLVDGGHDYTNSFHDMKNFARMSTAGRNIIIADDLSAPGVRAAWLLQLKNGVIEELRCSFKSLPDFREINIVVGKISMMTSS